MVGGGRPLLPEILGQPARVGAKSPIVNLAKIVQLTLIGSPLRAFQQAKDDHRTLPLSPPKWGFKTQNGRFSSIIELRLKKVCYKISLCENCQRHSLA